jgi:hypothetical protein
LQSTCRQVPPAQERARPSSTATDPIPTRGGGEDERLGPVVGAVWERPDASGVSAGEKADAAAVVAVEKPDAVAAAERGNPAAVGPNEAEAGAVTGQPDTAKVEAEVATVANDPPAVEEGRARIRPAAVEEPSGACGPPRGDQAGGTESTRWGGGISRQTVNH